MQEERQGEADDANRDEDIYPEGGGEQADQGVAWVEEPGISFEEEGMKDGEKTVKIEKYSQKYKNDKKEDDFACQFSGFE